MIELVAATALFGFILLGIALLSRVVLEDMQLVESEPEEGSHQKLISYLSRRVDEIVVVTGWDSTSVQYLDHRGEMRIINLETLTRAYGCIQDEENAVSSANIVIEPRPVNTPGLGMHTKPFIMTITIHSGGETEDPFRLQQPVMIRLKNSSTLVQQSGSPGR